jgi:hypothetical protein
LALFERWSVDWVPRAENQRADELGRMMSQLALPEQIDRMHPR